MTPPHGTCKRAPRGWWCSRSAGHDGPCAARVWWWNIPGVARMLYYGIQFYR